MGRLLVLRIMRLLVEPPAVGSAAAAAGRDRPPLASGRGTRPCPLLRLRHPLRAAARGCGRPGQDPRAALLRADCGRHRHAAGRAAGRRTVPGGRPRLRHGAFGPAPRPIRERASHRPVRRRPARRPCGAARAAPRPAAARWRGRWILARTGRPLAAFPPRCWRWCSPRFSLGAIAIWLCLRRGGICARDAPASLRWRRRPGRSMRSAATPDPGARGPLAPIRLRLAQEHLHAAVARAVLVRRMCSARAAAPRPSRAPMIRAGSTPRRASASATTCARSSESTRLKLSEPRSSVWPSTSTSPCRSLASRASRSSTRPASGLSSQRPRSKRIASASVTLSPSAVRSAPSARMRSASGLRRGLRAAVGRDADAAHQHRRLGEGLGRIEAAPESASSSPGSARPAAAACGRPVRRRRRSGSGRAAAAARSRDRGPGASRASKSARPARAPGRLVLGGEDRISLRRQVKRTRAGRARPHIASPASIAGRTLSGCRASSRRGLPGANPWITNSMENSAGSGSDRTSASVVPCASERIHMRSAKRAHS
ncbi:MAG: hypothetical protein KatS3mg119_1425 [Rhodothalassiaceae bacterium]|nr:MAG: hypothetical protein KatS3mg119_1425 [Rhodothalassiaceae bacterium]